jgi:hypothetical protein
MMITCSSKPDLSLHESLYHLQHPLVGVLHQMNAKNVLQRLNKEHMKRNLKTLRHTEKRPLHANRRRQLGGEPPVHNRSVVKIFYNRDIVSR